MGLFLKEQGLDFVVTLVPEAEPFATAAGASFVARGVVVGVDKFGDAVVAHAEYMFQAGAFDESPGFLKESQGE